MVLHELFDVILDRKLNPYEGSYTCSLFTKGLPFIAQKVGEESAEVIVAALAQEKECLVDEIADLTYHILVLMAAKDILPEDVSNSLKKRREAKKNP